MDIQILISKKGTQVVTATNLHDVLDLPLHKYNGNIKKWFCDIYAFQDEKIVNLIGEICNANSLYADESLYAGGISLMAKDNFLHPHLDNSHDAERERWRVFNLLYYVTPDWEVENGGHLELWPNGPKKEPIEKNNG